MNAHSGDHGYKQLYAFPGGSGSPGLPVTALLNVAGEFYGTTEEGGSASCGCGTVFKVSKSGTESTLYSFEGSPDGAYPAASLTALNGEFYGTTEEGGSGCSPSGGCGTVFEISPSGMESILYSFKGGTDGLQPTAGLTVVNGELYGTTTGGGTAGYGTVFKVSTSGSESVVHSFGNVPDGAYPYSGLLALHGSLYGTTYSGGTGAGYGTVFKMSMSGKDHVIYNFNPNSSSGDGESPEAGVIALNGKLYGTTYYGGTSGKGTIFGVSMSGKEEMLYSFAGGADGALPTGGLIAVNGALYGAAPNGGTYGGGCANDPSGCGLIFKITTSGKKTTLHTFQGIPDGEMPAGTLIAVNKVLYGTTELGGAPNFGTVLKIKP
ncbi:MAG: choice-of-anchor tandem repeat GloVer-containing protein [Candidatus Cybelea sp.]